MRREAAQSTSPAGSWEVLLWIQSAAWEQEEFDRPQLLPWQSSLACYFPGWYLLAPTQGCSLKSTEVVCLLAHFFLSCEDQDLLPSRSFGKPAKCWNSSDRSCYRTAMYLLAVIRAKWHFPWSENLSILHTWELNVSSCSRPSRWVHRYSSQLGPQEWGIYLMTEAVLQVSNDMASQPVHLQCCPCSVGADLLNLSSTLLMLYTVLKESNT